MKEALIGIELANAVRAVVNAASLKVPDGDIGLTCPECHQPVKPFKDGMQGLHFEHLARNPACSKSDA
jgi:hypothetical protein